MGRERTTAPLLTLFTIPKPFDGHIGIIQHNALASWRRALPGADVLLFGAEHGVDEAARVYRARHVPDIPCNNFGTPRLDAVFRLAHQLARGPLLAYVNTDILLLPCFERAVKRVGFARFLLGGRRWDLNVSGPLDHAVADWDGALRRRAREEGALHPPAGSDYFVFTRDSGFDSLPPFVVGRPVWDNWLIHRALTLGLPVLDASAVVTVIHQNHDYGHVAQRRGHAWEGPEADANRALAGLGRNVPTLANATHVLTEEGIEAANGTTLEDAQPASPVRPAI